MIFVCPRSNANHCFTEAQNIYEHKSTSAYNPKKLYEPVVKIENCKPSSQ
jgi:hypothetical protein